jgi:hypothetical protein
MSTRFVLIDADWKPVWSLSVPKPETAWTPSPPNDPAILAADGDGRFALWNLHERVGYEVSPDEQQPGGWAVREMSRGPWTAAPEASAPAEPALLPLHALAAVPLDAVAPPTGPVHDVQAFGFDAEGHVLLVRGERNAPTLALLRLGLDGELLGEVTFHDPTAGAEGQRTWHALARDRWLFTLSRYGEDVRSRAWIVDAASGATDEIEGFAGPFLNGACATPDGGIVVLGDYHQKYTSNTSLMSLDASGKRRWEIVQSGYAGLPSELMSCQDVAADAGGSVLVLDSTRDAVLVFNASGEYQRTVKLPAAWAGEQVYPIALHVLPGGDWLVHDASAHAWHRMTPQGDDRGSFVGRREDGGPEPGRAVCVDAAGTLWGTDGTQIYAFDSDGVARTRLGAPPDVDVLGEPQSVRVDTLGRIAVSDRRTHAVHLFDGAGRPSLVLRPEPSDFDTALHLLEPVVADSRGRTAIQLDSFKCRYLVFAPDGRRVGVEDLGGQQVAFVPGGSDRWVATRWLMSNGLIRRLTAEGRELVRRDRRPNHDYFLEVRALGCAVDGSVWVLSGPTPWVSTTDLVLDHFSPTGEPQRSVSLAAAPKGYWDSMAVTDRWLLISSFEDTALLMSLADETLAAVHCDGVSKKGCAFGFSPDGAELWCVLLEPLELRRFALPE